MSANQLNIKPKSKLNINGRLGINAEAHISKGSHAARHKLAPVRICAP